MGANTETKTPLLTETETAEYLKIKVRTLQAWRCRGNGPQYRKLGRAVRYAAPDLEAWLTGQSRSHTSQEV